MTEQYWFDDTPLDVQICADPSVRAELERFVEPVNARLARSLCRTVAPVPSTDGKCWGSSVPARLVVDNGAEFTCVDIDSFWARFRNRGGFGRG